MTQQRRACFATVADPRRALLCRMFAAAVDSAMPAHCVPPHLPPAPKGRTIVIGAGKASAAMAQAVEHHWPGPLTGVVVTRYGHAVPCERIRILEAAHPVPDAAGVAAADEILAAVANLTVDDLVLCLISGGGSALLPALPASISLEEEQALQAALLRSGATIAEMNCVRKHVSRIKGGRLAQAAYPACVHTLLISDVPGDDPAVIASGPTIADPSSREDALAILARHGIEVPSSVRAWLNDPASETPKPGSLDHASHAVIATAQTALEAAAAVATAHGYRALILGSAIEGEARDVGIAQAEIVHQILERAEPVARPCVLLSGGETTVTVRHEGRGGRNAEFLLSLLIALRAAPGVCAIAADTDGIDGTQDNAGAIIDETSLDRAGAAGVDADDRLRANDAYGFFDAVGDLVVTGATRTNVNDFRAILIDAPRTETGA